MIDMPRGAHHWLGILAVALTGCGGGEISDAAGTTDVAVDSSIESTTILPSSTSTTSTSTSTTSTSTTSTSTTSTSTTIPAPVPQLVDAAPLVDGYSYGVFREDAPAFAGGVAVAVAVQSSSSEATLTIDEPPTPLTMEDQIKVLRGVEADYGRSASTWVGWRRLSDFPALAFGDNQGAQGWLWFHDGLLFQVLGDATFSSYVEGVGFAQHPQGGTPPEALTLLEGTVASRFLHVPDYTYVVPPPGLELTALEESVIDGLHYAMRIVAGPGVEVTVVDQFNIATAGSDVVFVEASELSLLNWGNFAAADVQEGDLGNGLRVEMISDVPVYMSDTNWEWIDGPMHMVAWIGDAKSFARMRPFLEQLVAAQVADPLSTTDWWVQE
jgi:hypothetical protein